MNKVENKLVLAIYVEKITTNIKCLTLKMSLSKTYCGDAPYFEIFSASPI